MNYRPQAIDVDKLEKMLDMHTEHNERTRQIEAAKVEAYHKGYQNGLRAAYETLDCSNYEKNYDYEKGEAAIEKLEECGYKYIGDEGWTGIKDGGIKP